MKKFFKFAAIAAAAIALVSCGKDSQDDGQTPGGSTTGTEYNENLEFTLDVTEVKPDQAKISVEHNGTTKDTWYGFVTTETNVDAAIKAEVAKITSTGKVSLKKNTKTTITLRDLNPETEYTYIVFGLTAEGKTYGKAGSIKFKTEKEEVVVSGLVESDDWKIAYAGRENNTEIFTIECAESSIYYFEVINESQLLDKNGDLHLQDYMLTMADQIKAYLAKYSVDVLIQNNMLIQGGGALSTGRMMSDTYYAFAIGFNADGTLTGTYSAVKFTIEKETPTAEYSQWLGTYTVTDQQGLSYTLTIHEYDPNFMYAVTGWECGEWLVNGNSGMDFGTAFGDYVVSFPTYYSDGMMLFTEEFITYLTVSDQSGKKYETTLGFYGFSMSDQGLSLALTGGSILAYAEPTSGDITVNGVDLEDENGNKSAVAALGYAAIATDYSTYFQWNQPMALPLTMVKEAAAPVALQSTAAPMTINRKSYTKDFSMVAPKPAVKSSL